MVKKHEQHGESYTKEYNIYRHLKGRCYNKNNAKYPRYGGRGIKVCDRWLESYSTFLDDMGRAPKGYSIDRINNDGDYCPENCRWASPKQQACNTSKNRWIKYGRHLIRTYDFASLMGIKSTTVTQRLNAYEWTTEETFFTPVGCRRGTLIEPCRTARG